MITLIHLFYIMDMMLVVPLTIVVYIFYDIYVNIVVILLLYHYDYYQYSLGVIIIIPNIAHLRPDEIGKMDEFIKAGEEAALEKIDEIKKLVFAETLEIAQTKA